MCHWSGGNEGSDEKGPSGGWAFVCVPGPGRCGYGTDAVGRGAAGSPALSLHPLCSSGQAWPISLVVGPWHLNIPPCYFHTKRSSGLPQAQALPFGVIRSGTLPPQPPTAPAGVPISQLLPTPQPPSCPKPRLAPPSPGRSPMVPSFPHWAREGGARHLNNGDRNKLF